MKVSLIRHVNITTPGSIVQGPLDDIMVSDRAKDQIEILKELHKDTEKRYCSNLPRAQRTAKLIFNDQPVIYTDYLNEYVRPSRFIGGPTKDLADFWNDHAKDKYDINWKPEDGESYKECADRALAFYNQLIEDRQNNIKSVVVVGHGTLFRHLVCALSGVMEWQDNPAIVIDLLRKFQWDNLEQKNFEI